MRTYQGIGEETEKSKARNMEFAGMRDNEGAGKSLVSRGIVYFRTSPGSNGSAVERQRNLRQSAGLGARQSAIEKLDDEMKRDKGA
jgi:hypothetical protein